MPSGRKSKTQLPAPAAATESPENVMDEATYEDVPHDEVSLEAYSLYCERGGQDGDDLGDWLAAEQIVRERRRGQR
jgi:hypothetical protein